MGQMQMPNERKVTFLATDPDSVKGKVESSLESMKDVLEIMKKTQSEDEIKKLVFHFTLRHNAFLHQLKPKPDDIKFELKKMFLKDTDFYKWMHKRTRKQGK